MRNLKELYEKDIVMLPNSILYPHQRKAWSEFNNRVKKYAKGVKLLILEWHRRCGKDILLIQLLAKEAVKVPGNYYYVFPEKRQAREAIFEGIDGDGRRILDYIPHQLIHRIKEQEMVIYIKTGTINAKGECVYSTIQFVGSESDTKVGTSIKGVVFSEYAICNPKIWYYLEPSVARTNGFAGFISTPRGEQNHMVQLINANLDNPKAFIWEQMTIEDSKDFAGNPIFSVEEYHEKIRQGLPEETAKQEYYCDRVTASAGAYYKKQFADLYDKGQIGEFEDVYDCPVHFGMDIGFSDRCVLWVGYKFGKKNYIMDYYSNSGENIDHYIDWILDYMKLFRCSHARLYLPHDCKHTDRGSGRTVFQRILTRLHFINNIKPIIIPKTNNILDDIDEVRRLLEDCYFNTARCFTAIQYLKNYTKKENKTLMDFDAQGSKPLHDEASNYADGFRYLLFGMRKNLG